MHVAKNKDKILAILYSSKMHSKESLPQRIKITGVKHLRKESKTKFFCPFMILKQYLSYRGDYESITEPFFIFRNGVPVQQNNVRLVLSKLIKNLWLNPRLYGTHSLRTGRASDLLKLGFTIEEIKRAG